MSLGDRLGNRLLQPKSGTSIAFNLNFQFFIFCILYIHTYFMLSHHLCIITLSHFILCHFRTFTFYNFRIGTFAPGSKLAQEWKCYDFFWSTQSNRALLYFCTTPHKRYYAVTNLKPNCIHDLNPMCGSVHEVWCKTRSQFAVGLL